MLDRGDLRGVKIGKEWRISRAELVRFVEMSGTSESQAQQAPGVLDVDGTPVVIDQVATLNPRDFRRAYPQLAEWIASPLEQ